MKWTAEGAFKWELLFPEYHATGRPVTGEGYVSILKAHALS